MQNNNTTQHIHTHNETLARYRLTRESGIYYYCHFVCANSRLAGCCVPPALLARDEVEEWLRFCHLTSSINILGVYIPVRAHASARCRAREFVCVRARACVCVRARATRRTGAPIVAGGPPHPASINLNRHVASAHARQTH